MQEIIKKINGSKKMTFLLLWAASTFVFFFSTMLMTMCTSNFFYVLPIFMRFLIWSCLSAVLLIYAKGCVEKKKVNLKNDLKTLAIYTGVWFVMYFSYVNFVTIIVKSNYQTIAICACYGLVIAVILLWYLKKTNHLPAFSQIAQSKESATTDEERVSGESKS